MTVPQWKDIRDRARKIDVPFRVLAALASTKTSPVHASETSIFLTGGTLSADKQQRLNDALKSVEDLVASTEIKVNLTDAKNVCAAIAKLAEMRRSPATAPWKSRYAVAPYNDTAVPLDDIRAKFATQDAK